MVAAGIGLGGDAGVARGEAAHDVADRGALQERHGGSRSLVVQAQGRREGADLEFQGLQARVLHPGLVDLAGVLDTRAAEVEQDAVVPVAEGRAVDADAGAAEDGSVLQVPGVAQIDVAGVGAEGGARAAKVGGDRAGRLLDVGRAVELGDHVEVGGELAVGGGDARLAVGDDGLVLFGLGVAQVADFGHRLRLQVGQLGGQHLHLRLQGLQLGVARVGGGLGGAGRGGDGVLGEGGRGGAGEQDADQGGLGQAR